MDVKYSSSYILCIPYASSLYGGSCCFERTASALYSAFLTAACVHYSAHVGHMIDIDKSVGRNGVNTVKNAGRDGGIQLSRFQLRCEWDRLSPSFTRCMASKKRSLASL